MNLRSPCLRRRVSTFLAAGCLVVGNTAAAQTSDSRATPAKAPESAAIPPAKAKAMKLIIPQMQFAEASLEQALSSIAAKAKELDADKKGIVIKGPEKPAAKTLTLDIRNVSVWDLLSVAGELTDHHPEAGPDGIIFKQGALPQPMPDENSPLRKKAEGIRIPKTVFEKASVEEMVDYVRRHSAKPGLKIILGDIDIFHYDLTLPEVSAWEALDKIASAAGMTLSIRKAPAGTPDSDAIVVKRGEVSVEDLGVPDALVTTPQYRAIRALNLPAEKTQGTLAEAVASFAKGIQTASDGKLKPEFKVAPGIAKTKFVRDMTPSHAAYRFIVLADFGKYEWALEGETFLLKPAAKKK